jgi:hypothetical protein
MDINKVTIPLANVDIGPFFWKNSSTSLAYAEIRDIATGKAGIVSNQGVIIVPPIFDIVQPSVYGGGETVGFQGLNHGSKFRYFDMYGTEHDCAVWLYHNGVIQLHPNESGHVELVGVKQRFSGLRDLGKYVVVCGLDEKWSIYEAGRQWVPIASDVSEERTSLESTPYIQLLEYYSNVTCRYGGRLTANRKNYNITPEFSSVRTFGDALVKMTNKENSVHFIDASGDKVFEIFSVGNLFGVDLKVMCGEDGRDTGYLLLEAPKEAIAIEIQSRHGYVKLEVGDSLFCLLSCIGQVIAWAKGPIRYCGKANDSLSFLVEDSDTQFITVPDLSLTHR